MEALWPDHAASPGYRWYGKARVWDIGCAHELRNERERTEKKALSGSLKRVASL